MPLTRPAAAGLRAFGARAERIHGCWPRGMERGAAAAAAGVRGSHLSNITCLMQVSFKSGEYFGRWMAILDTTRHA